MCYVLWVSIEPLDALIEDLRFRAIAHSADCDLRPEDMLEWDLADTLEAMLAMLRAAAEKGGEAAVLAVDLLEKLSEFDADKLRQSWPGRLDLDD
jgi:hypothetical protein